MQAKLKWLLLKNFVLHQFHWFKYHVNLVSTAFFCCFFFQWDIALAQFTISPQGLATQYPQQVNDYIQKVKSLLPPLMIQRLSQTQVTLEFKSLNNGTQLAEHNHASDNKKIIIDISVLLALINKSTLSLPPAQWDFFTPYKLQQMGVNSTADLTLPKYKTVGQMIIGLLIHEIAHIYDNLQVVPREYVKDAGVCVLSMYPLSSPPPAEYKRTCEKIAYASTTVSTLKEYLSVAWWPDRGFMNIEPTNINQLILRSPDYYEWSSGNVKESFAVNMEFFLTDPYYKCRRPNLYSYLSGHFNNFVPFAGVSCDIFSSQIVIFRQETILNKDSKIPALTLRNLDFSRLYAIHYLFASEDEESIVSMYGHSMIRLVFCAPWRKTMGPECVNDINYHYVGNFQASIHSLMADPLSGLSGDYPTILFMSPMQEVIKEYTSTYWRDLKSLPLKFSNDPATHRARMKKVFDAIIETHWSYRGKYFLLGSNCAHETFNILKMGYLHIPRIFDSYEGTPSGLYKRLVELKIADNSVFNNLTQAWNEGYYFPSEKNEFTKSIDKIKTAGFLDKDLDPMDYLETTPVERAVWIQHLIDDNSLPDIQKKVLLTNFYDLEDIIYSRRTDSFLGELYPKIDDNVDEYLKKTHTPDDVATDFRHASELIDRLISPSEALNLTEGYGIPNKEDLKNKFTAFMKTNYISRIQKVADKVYEIADQIMPNDNQNELNQIRNNLKIIYNATAVLIDKEKKGVLLFHSHP